MPHSFDRFEDFFDVDTFSSCRSAIDDWAVESSLVESITYEVYETFLNGSVSEAAFSRLVDRGKEILSILKPVKDVIMLIVKEFGIGMDEVVKAFRERSVFQFLKSIKFNLKVVFRAIQELGSLVRQGLLKIFEEIHQKKLIQDIRKGVMKVDDLLNQYPLLKRVGGIVVAGILIYMWLNMTFIGDVEYDFNFTHIVMALMGKFTLVDLFLSPTGLMLLTLTATGGIISVPWLGASMANLALGIFYTAYIHLKKSDRDSAVLKKVRSYIKIF